MSPRESHALHICTLDKPPHLSVICQCVIWGGITSAAHNIKYDCGLVSWPRAVDDVTRNVNCGFCGILTRKSHHDFICVIILQWNNQPNSFIVHPVMHLSSGTPSAEEDKEWKSLLSYSFFGWLPNFPLSKHAMLCTLSSYLRIMSSFLLLHFRPPPHFSQS